MSGTGYGELLVDLGSGDKIHQAFEGLLPEGVQVMGINKLHATIMYDVRNPDITPSKSNKVYKCKVTGVDQLGDVGSKWAAAVILLECDELQARFKELLSEGFEHSYPDLMIHVSLSYGQDTAEILPILKTLFDEGKLPKTITLCNETWTPCKD